MFAIKPFAQIKEQRETKEETYGFKWVPSHYVFTESAPLGGVLPFHWCVYLLSLYDSIVPNVCDSTTEGGVHSALRFPAVFVKGDLSLIFYCKLKKTCKYWVSVWCFAAAKHVVPFIGPLWHLCQFWSMSTINKYIFKNLLYLPFGKCALAGRRSLMMSQRAHSQVLFVLLLCFDPKENINQKISGKQWV